MATLELAVLVTGLSGAGKSTALHALEDLGFYCIDNLPPPVLRATLDACAEGGVRRVAFGIDVRVQGFFDEAVAVVDDLTEEGHVELAIVFLDASDQALLRRFSSTRRPHPLSTAVVPGGEGAALAVLDGVRIERERLASLRARASLIIDTTALSVHELRRRVIKRFTSSPLPAPSLRVRIVSFGFKYGAPVDADMLLDVRFLANPYFVPSLSDLPGTHHLVRDYVLALDDAQRFLALTTELLRFLLPRFQAEGKSYLTVGVGCTGGRHRSVVIAERLHAAVGDLEGASLELLHRDVERAGADGRISDVGTPPPPPSGEGQR